MNRAVRPQSGPASSIVRRCGIRRRAWPLLLVLALAGGSPAVFAQTCGAAGGDNRPGQSSDCEQTGPANHPSVEPATATANSIDLVTGNKYLHEIDAAWPDGLVLSRHYNSRNPYERSLGVAWTHGFETTLVRVHRGRMRSPSKAVVELQVIQADGRRLVFRAVREPSRDRRVLRFRAVDPAYGSVIERPDAAVDRRYLWRWRNGRQLSFDEDGRLTAVDDAHGLRLSLDYQPVSGRLERVTTHSGLSLGFEYFGESDHHRGVAGAASGRLAAVVQSDGTRVRYRYDSAGLLAEVLHPSGENSRFAYEDAATPHAVTRWTDGGGRPRGDYRYDQQGRAIYSARAGGVEAVWLTYQLPDKAGEPGQTRVVDSAGRASVFVWRYLTHTHQAMILRASGDGCTACPPVGVQRHYDHTARLVEERFGDGALRILRVHDRAGRLAELRAVTGPGGGSRSGAAAQWPAAFVRYRHASDDPEAPVVAIEVPSFATGQVRRVRFEHDEVGRITARIESGFTPDLRTLGRDLKPTRWLPIERRTTYRWVGHGGARGRLQAVDGPLAGDGDSVRHEYDQRGWMIATLRPEGISERFVRDRYGRVGERIDPAGVVQRHEYDATGSLSAIERGGLRSAVDYSRGVLNPSLHSPVLGALHFAFDDAGRLASVTDALGGRLEIVHGSDGGVLRARIGKRQAGALTTILDAGPGEPPVPPNPVAWGSGTSAVRHTGDGRTLFTVADRPRTIWLRDDFGRLVAQGSVEHGVLVHRHDEAGRRIASGDAGGLVVVRRFDAAGRLIAQGTPDDPLKVQYHYQGALLKWVSDPMQTIAYLHDRLGRVVAQGHLIGERSGPPSARRAFATTRHFDERGRLAGETLPDGHAIGYAYLANGSLSAVAVRTPARRLQVVASAIEWIPFAAPGSGLMGLVFGNAIRAVYRHDRFGRIVEVDHRRPGTAPAAAGLPAQRIRYDARGMIVDIDEPARRFGYAHDAAGRLIAAASAGTGTDDPSIDYEGFGYGVDGRRRVTVSGSGRWSPDGSTMLRVVSQAVHRDDPAGRAAAGHGAGADTVRPSSADAYNHTGERVRSIPVDGDRRPRYFIHHDGRLVAEVDADGHLVDGYVRIGGRPVATLRSGPAGDTILYLHSDHLGTHRTATGRRAEVVQALSYTAFGKPADRGFASRNDGFLLRHAAAGADRTPHHETTPRPRRLGQFADPGSPLHYNHRRWYEPERGRFTTPDPLGVLAGHDPYAYAAHDPVRLTDPSGLYETDIHFYMMYFLARVSGLSESTSLTIAQASQFVDDNQATRPLPNLNIDFRPPLQPQRLANYHITQVGQDPDSLPGESDADYAMRRILNPVNPQLATLLAHANRNLQTETNPGGVSPCARAQLFGEYLHVFADTFAHRNSENEPIALYGGLGHVLYGSSPDFTFNHVASHQFMPVPFPRTVTVYQMNEYRTLQMERAVMTEIARNFGVTAIGPDGLPIRFEDVAPVLQQFNALRETDGCGGPTCWPGKIALLERALDELGLGALPRYSVDASRDARIRNLQGLSPSDYRGAILMTQ